jgi:hypothetical protein
MRLDWLEQCVEDYNQRVSNGLMSPNAKRLLREMKKKEYALHPVCMMERRQFTRVPARARAAYAVAVDGIDARREAARAAHVLERLRVVVGAQDERHDGRHLVGALGPPDGIDAVALVAPLVEEVHRHSLSLSPASHRAAVDNRRGGATRWWHMRHSSTTDCL